jgi:hypothetical protein
MQAPARTVTQVLAHMPHQTVALTAIVPRQFLSMPAAGTLVMPCLPETLLLQRS